MGKAIGKILEFDGYSATLVDREGREYMVPNHEILGKVEVNDIVTFEADVYKTVDVEINIARFVKKLEPEKAR